MFLPQLCTNYDRRCITRAREVHDFARRAFGIYRNARRTRLQHAEVSHAPFRRVVAEQDDSISRLDSLRGEKCSGACRQLAQISIRVLFFSSIAFDAHRNARRVTLRRSFKKLDQVAIGVDALWL